MSEEQFVRLGQKPDDCSLDDTSLVGRLADWHTALGHVRTRRQLDDGLRLEFGHDAPIGRLAELVAAEQSCCSFFRFAIVVDGRGIALEVRTDPIHRQIVTDLFGPV